MDEQTIKQAQGQLKQQQQNVEKQEQTKNVLKQCMTKEALERLSRLALVKPEKAEKIQTMILQNAQMGLLKAKIDERQLISQLEDMNDIEEQATKITFKRKVCEDSDDELFR